MHDVRLETKTVIRTSCDFIAGVIVQYNSLKGGDTRLLSVLDTLDISEY